MHPASVNASLAGSMGCFEQSDGNWGGHVYGLHTSNLCVGSRPRGGMGPLPGRWRRAPRGRAAAQQCGCRGCWRFGPSSLGRTRPAPAGRRGLGRFWRHWCLRRQPTCTACCRPRLRCLRRTCRSENFTAHQAAANYVSGHREMNRFWQKTDASRCWCSFALKTPCSSGGSGWLACAQAEMQHFLRNHRLSPA